MLKLAIEETRIQVARPLFWAIYTLLGFLVFLDINSTNASQSVLTSIGKVNHDAPLILYRSFLIVTLISIIAQPLITGHSILRDYTNKSYEIYQTLPYSGPQLIGGKLIGLLIINTLLYSSLLLGSYIGAETLPSSFQSSAILTPYIESFLMLLPLIFFIVVLISSIGIYTKSSTTMFLGSVVFLFSLIILSSLFSKLKIYSNLVLLIDVSGFSYLERLFQSPDFSVNCYSLFKDSYLIVKGAILIGMSFLCYSFIKNKYGYSGDSSKSLWRKSMYVSKDTSINLDLFKITTAKIQVSLLSQFRIYFCYYLRKTLLNPALIILTLLIVSQVYSNFYKNIVNYSLEPTTSYLLLNGFQGIKEPIILIVIFISGILVWHEKNKKIEELIQTYPMRSWVLNFSKLGSIVTVLLIIFFALIAFGIGIQLWLGYDNIALIDVIRFLATDFVSLFLACTGFLLIQLLSPNQYVGYGVSLIIVLCSVFMSNIEVLSSFQSLGFIPKPLYSETLRFGPIASLVIDYQLLWLTLSALWLLFIFSIERNQDHYLNMLRRIGKVFLQKWTLIPATILIIAFSIIAFKIYIQYENTSVLSPASIELARANYEKELGDYLDKESPKIINTVLNIKLSPDTKTCKIEGTYRLKNNSTQPIKEFIINHYLQNQDFADIRLKSNSAIANITFYQASGASLIKLKNSLSPGDSILLKFESVYENNQLNIDNPNRYFTEDVFVLANYLPFEFNLFPTIGFDRSRLLLNKDQRNKYGLEDKPNYLVELDSNAVYTKATHSWTDFTAKITLPKDFDIIAYGESKILKESFSEKIVEFHVNQPISNEFTIIAGRFQKENVNVGEYNFELYKSGKTEKNWKRIEQAIQIATPIYHEKFGSIMHKNINIVQIPSFNLIEGTALSKPGIILWDESGGLYNSGEKEVDRVFSTAAHELSHQWFAHAVKPASYVTGGVILNETLAQLSRILAIEESSETENLREYIKSQVIEYYYGRSARMEVEVPLISSHQGFVAYQKGALAMNTLLGYLGKEKVLKAIRNYYDEFAYQEDFFPTTYNLYKALKNEAPSNLHYLLDDLFLNIVNYEIKFINDVTRTKEDKIRFSVRKFNKGDEIPILSETIQIALLGKQKTSYQWIQIKSGENIIEVPDLVKEIILDPNHYLIDFGLDNNILTLK